jgi:hypothetical protein
MKVIYVSVIMDAIHKEKKAACRTLGRDGRPNTIINYGESLRPLS